LKANEPITAFLINVAVVVLYAKTGGKNAKHAAMLKSPNISELSHLGLQLFENVINRQFRAVPEATAIFQTHQYTLCSPNAILCLLHRRPESVHNHIQVSVEDGQLFRGLRTGKNQVLAAQKLLRRRKQGDLDGE
jgi:hypothetical protein